jgi:hypothetical protein
MFFDSIKVGDSILKIEGKNLYIIKREKQIDTLAFWYDTLGCDTLDNSHK